MPLSVDVVDSLASVPPAAWDALTGDANPFVEHAFLHALEQSGSVGERDTGWVPRHVLVYDGARLVGAMPAYEKYDSYGEYIFDWGWARAAQHAGIPYYPKLVTAVPFTPATGPRLLTLPDVDRLAVWEQLLTGLDEVGRGVGASSQHLLFITDAEQHFLASEHGFMPRLSYQFHWHRQPGWNTFDDFLAALRAPTRKQVRRERRIATGHGLQLSVRLGSELGPAEWDALWRFYRQTICRKWAIPYLRREFFAALAGTLRERVVAAFAHDGSTPVAGALMFSKGDHLFGRYWGAERPYDALHFELCYYLPIEWGLANGIERIEAGAQGQHKLKRGFLPRLCRSAHRIEEPHLAAAVQDFLRRESVAVEHEVALLGEHTPFKRG